MSTLEILQGMLIKDYALSRAQVTPDASLSMLGIDSLDMIDFFFRVEDRFGLKLKDDVPATLVTISDLVQFIDGLITHQEKSSKTLGPKAAQSE